MVYDRLELLSYQAVRRIQAEFYDLLVINIKLPIMNGFQVYIEISKK